MKNKILIFLISSLLLIACKNKWDDYYNAKNEEIVTEELPMTIKEFLESKPEYSDFYALLQSTGLDAELVKDQLLTVWVVNNGNLAIEPITSGDTVAVGYHLNYLPYSVTTLKSGVRILAMNGIYLEIKRLNDSLAINDAKIIGSYKLKNGFVYEITKSLSAKMNLLKYIEKLGDDYSIIRDTILKYNTKVFDVANSTPIGVDATGNTIYDSVFNNINSFYNAKANFLSEYEQFTAFIPSNAVIEACFGELTQKYTQMGSVLTLADTLTAYQWIKESVFYTGILTDFSQTDITSPFSRVWRTTVQQLDLSDPVTCSNGVAYKVTKMKIPNNVMIYRIKSFFHYWDYLTDDDKKSLFTINYADTADNVMSKVDGGAAAGANYSPDQDLWRYWCLQVGSTDKTLTSKYSLTCVPLERYYDNTGTPRARVMKVPPGEYTFYLGVWSGKSSSLHPFISVYFNDQLIQADIQVSKSTPWNFDRVTETATDRGIVGAPSKFDGLGGLVGTVTIPGDVMTSFNMKIEFSSYDGVGQRLMRLYHWSLKPTSNNY